VEVQVDVTVLSQHLEALIQLWMVVLVVEELHKTGILVLEWGTKEIFLELIQEHHHTAINYNITKKL
tara:strand:- start:397 stop:597 length:201 start_codon:yes stop_codon:yes gene_type:complete